MTRDALWRFGEGRETLQMAYLQQQPIWHSGWGEGGVEGNQWDF